MASVSVTREAIRAKIKLGTEFKVETPDVMSFSVRRARGQMSAQFSASIRVAASDITTAEIVASTVTIEAGRKGREKLIFTGKVYKAVINPIKTDASKILLNISGKDGLAELEGQKVNRRLTNYKDGDTPPQRWGVVNSVLKHSTPSREKFKVKVSSKEKEAIVDMKNEVIMSPVSFASEKIAKAGNYQKAGGLSFIIKHEEEGTEGGTT